MLSAICFNSDQSKILSSGNVLLKNMKFVFGRVENIVGKGENAEYQHFLLFPQMFSKAFFSRGVKSRDCVVKG